MKYTPQRRFATKMLAAFAVFGAILGCASVPTPQPTDAASALTSPIVAKIPFTIDYDGWITIDVMVNGQGPYPFVLDTGATVTSVFDTLAQELVFPPQNKPPVRVLGLINEASYTPVTLGTLYVGAVDFTPEISVVLPGWPAPRRTPAGILGLDFLTQYDALIDIAKSELVLFAPVHSLTRPLGWQKAMLDKLYFEGETKPLFGTRLSIGQRRTECVIDIGASGTVLNKAGAKRVLSNVGSSGKDRRERLGDVFGEEVEVALLAVDRLRIGRRAFSDKTVAVLTRQFLRR